MFGRRLPATFTRAALSTCRSKRRIPISQLQNDPDFKDDLLAPLEVVGVGKVADSAVVIKARLKTKPIKQWREDQGFNRRLKKKFGELNNEIPFPHITLHPGKDRKGDSPTLKVEVQGGEK
jgi:small-conductance mechanosensitive channel